MTNEQAFVKEMIDNLALLREHGALSLSIIEKRMRVFCPFEAIGMVNQEIRHSNFLAYLLDPKRPHGLGSHFLGALISELRIASPKLWPDDLFQIEDLKSATVDRERMNIDILIEIPGSRLARSLVIAIEVKVHAAEGDEQLSRYQNKLHGAYPVSHWEHRRVFLTLDAREASTAGQDSWQPVSFDALLKRFDMTIATHRLAGPCVELYHDYQKMMRRHGMAQQEHDAELEDAVKKLWSEHREVLEFLIERRPAPVQDMIRIFDQNRDRFAEILSGKLGQPVHVDSDWTRWRRIAFPRLLDIDARMGDGDQGWVKSGSMAVLELNQNSGSIDASIAINKSCADPHFRIRLIEALSRETSTRPNVPKRGVRHFWYQTILTTETIAEAMDIEIDPLEYLAEQLAWRFRGQLEILYRCAETAGSS